MQGLKAEHESKEQSWQQDKTSLESTLAQAGFHAFHLLVYEVYDIIVCIHQGKTRKFFYEVQAGEFCQCLDATVNILSVWKCCCVIISAMQTFKYGKFRQGAWIGHFGGCPTFLWSVIVR